AMNMAPFIFWNLAFYTIIRTQLLSNIGALIAFILVSICTIILRKKHPEIQSGFKVPFMPILPIIAILFCLFLLINLPIFTWLYFGIWLCIGTGVYFFYSRKHTILK
ncbi:amino acid permease C-terminal domain-containing protein, partial [Paenibacillus larvae]